MLLISNYYLIHIFLGFQEIVPQNHFAI